MEHLSFYVAYNDADKDYAEEIEKWLSHYSKNNNIDIAIFSTHTFTAGTDLKPAIEEAIASVDIILPLLSVDFGKDEKGSSEISLLTKQLGSPLLDKMIMPIKCRTTLLGNPWTDLTCYPNKQTPYPNEFIDLDIGNNDLWAKLITQIFGQAKLFNHHKSKKPFPFHFNEYILQLRNHI